MESKEDTQDERGHSGQRGNPPAAECRVLVNHRQPAAVDSPIEQSLSDQESSIRREDSKVIQPRQSASVACL